MSLTVMRADRVHQRMMRNTMPLSTEDKVFPVRLPSRLLTIQIIKHDQNIMEIPMTIWFVWPIEFLLSYSGKTIPTALKSL